MVDVKVYYSQLEWVYILYSWWMLKSIKVNENGFTPFTHGGCWRLPAVNKNGFTPFANGRCQSLLQSTRIGLHPLLMVDVEVYYSQQEWVSPFAYGRCQSLLQSIRMGLHPFLMVDVEVYLQSTRMGLHPLLMVDVKVYYSQLEWVYILYSWWMSKSTTVNENGYCVYTHCSWWMSTTVNKIVFTPFANYRCQSLLETSKMTGKFLKMFYYLKS